MQLYKAIAFKTKQLLWVLLIGCGNCFASSAPNIQPPSVYSGIKLVENKGQWPTEVLFKANIPGGDLFITPTGLVYSFIDTKALHEIMHNGGSNTNKLIKGHNYKMTFANCLSTITVLKQNPSIEIYNYFLGNDEHQWASNCRAYQTVVLQNIYNGIDIEILSKDDYIKLNFIVHPYADPNQLQLVYEGMDKLQLHEGALSIETTVATIKEEKPVAFQHGVPINCQYQLQEKTVRFATANYNPAEELIIDPEIVFATYSGSTADNFGFTATFDAAGNGFSGGTVWGKGFPTTLGAFQFTFGGSVGSSSFDIGILKFTPNGKQLLYATYLGGTLDEQPHSLVCNAAGELYIMGTTKSSNFPTKNGSFDITKSGGTDIIVSKLSVDGTQLLGSTYIGGNDDDGINANNVNFKYDAISNPLAYNYGDFYRGEILLDQTENVYVASVTKSSTSEGFPLQSAFQSSFGGGNQDGVVFSLSPNLNILNFSSYLGGSGEDALYGIRFDSQNNIVVCGGTNSSNIGKNNTPIFEYKGGVDGFIAQINSSSFQLTKLIYIGTPAYDQTYFIDIDKWDHLYTAGQTLGGYPVKGNVYKNDNTTQFISILNPTLDSMQYSTTIGNGSASVNISPSAFMVDKCGKIYLSGWGGETNKLHNPSVGTTTNLTITPNAFQKTTDGSDFYFVILAENLAQLSYATFFGGPNSADHVDGGTSRFDKKGMIYQSICAGCRGFSDLPVTPGCYSPTNKSSNRNCNNALVKFNSDPNSNIRVMRDTLLKVFATDTLLFAFNLTNTLGDSIDIRFTGTLFSAPNAPTVTKIIIGNKVTGLLKWPSACANVTGDTFSIIAFIKIDGCFDTKEEIDTIKIIVLSPPAIVPPYPYCMSTINSSTVRLSWPITSYGKYFKRLEIYKSVAGSSFSLFKQFSDKTDTAVIDTQAYNHLVQNICYYFVGVNICDSISTQYSRYICSLFPLDSASHQFSVPNDTLIYITATDTLNYHYSAQSINPKDSVFIWLSGSVFKTGRVLTSTSHPNLEIATANIQWQSACEDINDTFTVEFFVLDNQCPQSRTKRSLVTIVVLPPPLVNPPVMKCTRNTGTNSVLVRWDKPTINKRYFSHFVLLRKNVDGTTTELCNITHDSALSFIDTNAIANKLNNICYAAFGVNVCDMHGDTSDDACTVINGLADPKPIYIYNTSVIQNEYLQLQWAKSTEVDFWKYVVLKQNVQKQTGFVQYLEIENSNDTILNDKSVDVHHTVYCYQIKQINDCGLINREAYNSCSILLKGKSIPFLHSFEWNDYDFYKNGLNKYVLVKQEPNQPAIEANSYALKNTLGTDNNLNKDNGLYHYTIEARELNSPFTSVSNTIELIQAPLLHVPNVFTANADGLNDEWRPAPVFVKEYILKLYDRWGQLIFETTDKKQPYDGKLNGSPTTADVFVYVITYTGWDGSTHTAKGNVTQLK